MADAAGAAGADRGVQPLLHVAGLAKHFDVSKPFLNRLFEGEKRQILRAVQDVSFDIPSGRTFSLVGESGCGKSTVARSVVGLYRPTGGSVVFEGADIASLKTRAGMKPMEETGKFDPHLHHAVDRAPADSDEEDQTILEVYQRGYHFKDRLLRPAMVKVAVKE